MDATRGGQKCEYCSRNKDHSSDCPMQEDEDGMPRLDSKLHQEWQDGWKEGFFYDQAKDDGEQIEESELAHYSPAFAMGYRAGREQIEESIRCAYEKYEYGEEY